MSSSSSVATVPQHAPSKPLSHPHELVMKEATAVDAEAIAKIGRTTFKACFAYSMPEKDMQAYLEKVYTPAAILEEIALSEKNRFFVAKLGSGESVGFVQMKIGTTEPCIPRDASVCELHRIYVSLDRLGGGAGQLMMEHGLNWARDHLLGLERINGAVDGINSTIDKQRLGVWLGVWEENLKAQRFYRRWGFERIGSHDFVMGETKQTDLIVVKWL
ncbi:MAG: hypothetical protein Q9219_006284 [cf. Caloplaca sp. 3 TL-2023]